MGHLPSLPSQRSESAKKTGQGAASRANLDGEMEIVGFLLWRIQGELIDGFPNPKKSKLALFKTCLMDFPRTPTRGCPLGGVGRN